MSLSLKANESCRFASRCPYNNGNCRGADPTRSNFFICDFVDSNGVFLEGSARNNLDVTGKMKVIVE